jgi:hypothetical protein
MPSQQCRRAIFRLRLWQRGTPMKPVNDNGNLDAGALLLKVDEDLIYGWAHSVEDAVHGARVSTDVCTR